MSSLNNFTPTSSPNNKCRKVPVNPINELTIGSTTTHTFSLPFIYSEYVKYCEIIYKQGLNVVLVKTDYTVQEENLDGGCSMIRVVLSPEDTLKFNRSLLDTFVQVKIVNIKGEVSYSTPNSIKILNPLDGGNKEGYLFKNKINDYLYEIEFDSLDYKYGYNYFKGDNKDFLGGCTSLRVDNFLARGYDWNYSKEPVFVVRTQAKDGFYATLGVTGSVVGFDDMDNVNPDLYKILPFRIVDGINEKGLAISINVVPSLGNSSTITTGSKYDDVCTGMFVRYCLDRFASVEELKRELPKHTSLFPMKNLKELGYEIHALIVDDYNTTVMEIVDNKIKFIDDLDNYVITNFHMNNVVFNEDGKVFSPINVADGYLPSVENHIELYGSGLERYNYAVEKLSEINGTIDEASLREIMNGLNYTRCYPTSVDFANPVWYTEFVGNYGDLLELTVDSPIDDFNKIMPIVGNLYSHRERGDGKTWFTEHSSIYDISNKALYIVCQEDTDLEYRFVL